MFVFNTLDQIKQYRYLINEFVKLQKVPPRPHDVFIYLLNFYQAGNIPVISTLFPPVHFSFVKQLINKLSNCSDVEVLIFINSYLKQTKLGKNEELFGLLVAYFYNYKSVYTELTPFTALIQQIIIPTNLLKKRLLDIEADIILKQADSEVPAICNTAIEALGVITITANKNETILQKLLEKIRSGYMSGGGATYRALANCKIPEKLQAEVIDLLLTKFNVRESDACINLCNTLSKIPIPQNKQKAVIDKLFEIANAHDWFIRVAAWNALEKMGVSSDDVDAWINPLIAKMDKPEALDKSTALISTANIPEKYCDIVVKKLLIKTDLSFTTHANNHGKYSSLICGNACDALGLIRIPAHLRSEVIDKLIVKIGGMQEGVPEAYKALVRLGIPKGLRKSVVTTLLKKIDLQIDSIHALTLLAAIPIPKAMANDVLQQLLNVFETLLKCHPIAIFKIFTKLELTEEKREEIFKLMFTKAEATQKEWDLYIALQNVSIPKKVQPFIFLRILNTVDKGNSASIARACNLKIELTTTERNTIINKLLFRDIKKESLFWILKALLSICSRGSLTEWITTHEKLESIVQKIPADERADIIATAQAFRNHIEIITSLPPKLSIEAKANIARFAR